MGIPMITLMLERCAQTIEDIIVPNLSDRFVSQQLTAIAGLLHGLAPLIEVQSQMLRQENERMREVLEVLRGEKTLSQNAIGNRLIERIDHALKKVEVGTQDVSEENANLKGTLVEVINGLDAITEALPVETVSSMKQQIRSVLREQIDHGISSLVGCVPRSES